MNTFEAKTYSPIFAFDLVLLDVLNEVVVESGAKLKANDLILIKTIHGEIITPENVYDVISPGDSISEHNKKFKKKTRATIYDKISYL